MLVNKWHSQIQKNSNQRINDLIEFRRALIQSLGILIGFSWERSFDEAVGGLMPSFSRM